jgi:hypothetical protein
MIAKIAAKLAKAAGKKPKAAKKKKSAKLKAKKKLPKKPAKRAVKKTPKEIEKPERIDLRLTNKQKAKLVAKARAGKRTVTSVMEQLIDRMK